MSSGKHSSISRRTSPLVQYYLVAFNVVSTIGWAYVLYSLLLHLGGVSATGRASSNPSSATALLSKLTAWGSSQWQQHKTTTIPPINRRVGWLNFETLLPQIIEPYLQRSSTAYTAVGPLTTLVQSLAVLEVVHAALGWVRSPVGTTAAQVASRIILVWGIAERFPQARSSPFYGSMVLAWSLTEVIRYPLYAFNLLNITPPYPLLWLRYSTFLILYPVGAGSEAFVNFATLPKSSPIPSIAKWAQGSTWSSEDLIRGGMFIIWWPGLYIMYTYMLGQRRKVLGGGAGRRLGTVRGSKPKTL